MVHPVIFIIDIILSAINIFLFIYIILAWLLHFRVVNYSHPFVRAVWDMLFRLFEPIMKRIRRFIPAVNGIDLSPIILFIIIISLRYTVMYYFGR